MSGFHWDGLSGILAPPYVVALKIRSPRLRRMARPQERAGLHAWSKGQLGRAGDGGGNDDRSHKISMY